MKQEFQPSVKKPVSLTHLPFWRNQRGRKHDHGKGNNEGNQKGEPEAFENSGNLDEKVGSLNFLLGCTPRNVEGEQVCKKSHREMDAEAAKEEDAANNGLSEGTNIKGMARTRREPMLNFRRGKILYSDVRGDTLTM